MKITFQISLLLTVLLFTAAAAGYLNAKEYRGIVPFHSTRADVIRLLGSTPDENVFRAKYESEKEIVYIGYSSGLDPNYHKCAKSLPPDTVMLIRVIHKTEPKLTDLQLDEEKFRKLEQSFFRGIAIFSNNEEGVFIRTFEDKIDQIKYTAAAKDRYLCPTFQQHPEAPLYLKHLPDEVAGNVRDNVLQPWLDQFYAELADDPTTLGVIINFGTEQEAAKRRAKIMKAFASRKYDARRLRFVRGSSEPGIRTQFFVSLPKTEAISKQ